MKDKTTLFEYLYENLKEQIVSGRIKCGESLPSMNSVSEQYNIGIRTVKDVFRALSSEGYIKTEERKAAVVIYSDNKDSQESAVKYVLERKSFIVEVYQTMALLMPELFCFFVSGLRSEIFRFMGKELEPQQEERYAKQMERGF